MNKTLVAIRTCADSNSYAVAKFVDCLVHHFSGSKDNSSVPVQCKLEGNQLRLSAASAPVCPNKVASTELFVWDQHNKRFFSPVSTHNVILQHSRECPIGNLSESDKEILTNDIQQRGIDVAVSVLLQSKDEKILMTRRPNHMRTFPRAWVPPGGHIEENETLIDAGLRELKEETGLTLGHGTVIQVFCLWESVYPFILGLGLPTRHHVVVYLLAKSELTSHQLTQQLTLDPEEVQACAWLTPESVKYLLNACEEPNHPTQDMYSLKSEGKLQAKPMILSTMFHPALWGKGEIYSGSQLALTLWYESLQLNSNSKL